MIDIELLKNFIEISASLSLMEASTRLKISQPTLTRIIKKLEDELGMEVFDRVNNRIILNDNGKFILDASKDYLKSYDDFLDKINKYKEIKGTIKIGYPSKGIIYKLQDKIFSLFDNKVSFEMDTIDNLKTGLFNKKYDIIFTFEEIKKEGFTSYFVGKENLLISVPKCHLFSSEKYLTFDDIKNCTFNYANNVFIDALKKNIPNINFSKTYNENNLTLDTNFCYHLNRKDDIIFIKITDKDAYLNYYITYQNKLDNKLKELK